MGRNAKELTEDEIAQMEALSAFLPLEKVADFLGIGRRTLYNIFERDPEIEARYKKGKAKAIASVAQGVVKRAIAGDNQCSFFYLKTQAGWKETVAQEHTSPDGSMTPTFQSMYGKPESKSD